MGTIGLLIEAREQRLIPAAAPLLLELRRLGQWLSEELLQAVQQEESRTSVASPGAILRRTQATPWL
jgi:hypothetical protein